MKTDKRNLILDTAEKLMTVTDDHDITINMIAQKAGIGKGSIYYYFQSKEEILDAVIDRCYKKALHEYFIDINTHATALEKIKFLFQSMIKKEFHDNQQNFIIALHLHDDLMLHNKMKLTAIQEVSPVLAGLLKQGIDEGSIITDTPDESAEMIVAVITYLFDRSIFSSDNQKTFSKMKLLASVLETCLHTAKGSFDFLFHT
ncbi:MAG: TetR/AcrR family transcriptional regulator [Porcipelethomonas sp.]